MSKYTTMVRYIVENMTYGSTATIHQRIRDACPLVFNFEYPIFDESHRRALEEKILKHYFLREIGLETVALWQLMLSERLNAIMPVYNIMYAKAADDLHIFDNIDILERTDASGSNEEHTDYSSSSKNNQTGTTTSSGNTDSTTSQESGQTTNGTSIQKVQNKTLHSDLPQANYAGVDYGTLLDETDGSQSDTTGSTTKADFSSIVGTVNKDSSTNTGEQTASSSSSNQINRNNIDERIRRLTGKQGGSDFASLFMQYKDSVLNIDMMIVRDLADLFMGVY